MPVVKLSAIRYNELARVKCSAIRDVIRCFVTNPFPTTSPERIPCKVGEEVRIAQEQVVKDPPLELYSDELQNFLL
jgi:hypothetical protein